MVVVMCVVWGWGDRSRTSPIPPPPCSLLQRADGPDLSVSSVLGVRGRAKQAGGRDLGPTGARLSARIVARVLRLRLHAWVYLDFVPPAACSLLLAPCCMRLRRGARHDSFMCHCPRASLLPCYLPPRALSLEILEEAPNRRLGWASPPRIPSGPAQVAHLDDAPRLVALLALVSGLSASRIASWAMASTVSNVSLLGRSTLASRFLNEESAGNQGSPVHFCSLATGKAWPSRTGGAWSHGAKHHLSGKMALSPTSQSPTCC